MRNIQILAPQQQELAENILLKPHEYFSIRPPEVRGFGTDRNFATEQARGNIVAQPGRMLTL